MKKPKLTINLTAPIILLLVCAPATFGISAARAIANGDVNGPIILVLGMFLFGLIMFIVGLLVGFHKREKAESTSENQISDKDVEDLK